MCPLLSGLYIWGDHEGGVWVWRGAGGGREEAGGQCVFKGGFEGVLVSLLLTTMGAFSDL